MPRRLYHAIRREIRSPEIYGLQWGDPESVAPLQFVRDRWVTPYVKSDQTGLEIGPGGGRWTRYLLSFQRLYVVDYYEDVLVELRKHFSRPNVVPIHNTGTDFPNVPEGTIDFIFSFGTFVHLDAPLIESYLRNMRKILKPGGNAVIHYSDKTKVMALADETFSDNDPARMRTMVTGASFNILEEDLTTMWHSALIRFAV